MIRVLYSDNGLTKYNTITHKKLIKLFNFTSILQQFFMHCLLNY